MDERTIADNIRQLRLRAGLTLTEAARRAELTKSTLSKIETGQASPPISTLLRIASALGCPLAQFFVEPQGDPPYVLTRSGEGTAISRDGSRFGYSYQALALAMRHKAAEPFVLTINPGDPIGRFRHGGDEFIYMLGGHLRFTVGAQALELKPGDSLYFNPALEHTTEVLGAEPVRFLCVFISPPGNPATRGAGRNQKSRVPS